MELSVLDIVLDKYSREQLIEKGINAGQMALYLIKDAMRQYFADGFSTPTPIRPIWLFCPAMKILPTA